MILESFSSLHVYMYVFDKRLIWCGVLNSVAGYGAFMITIWAICFNLLHSDESERFSFIYGAFGWIELHGTRHPTDLTLFLTESRIYFPIFFIVFLRVRAFAWQGVSGLHHIRKERPTVWVTHLEVSGSNWTDVD